MYTHYQKNASLTQKPQRSVFQGSGLDKRLETSRTQATLAQGKVLRMQSMLNRIERFELGEADFRDETRDFLREKDIFVDSRDRYLFKTACPVEFDRIERRERADKQEADKRLARETAARLLEKLDHKLSHTTVVQDSPATPSSSVATETHTSAVESEARQQMMRALDDRKAYMIEALQMQIALNIDQHKIIDDYQSPVNAPMYSESPHTVVSVCTAPLHHTFANKLPCAPGSLSHSFPLPFFYPETLPTCSQVAHRAGNQPLQEAGPEICDRQAYLVSSDSLLHPRYTEVAHVHSWALTTTWLCLLACHYVWSLLC